jgi:hypothetical protein
VTNPKAATTQRSGQRFYTWRGERYWSVTTIIGGGVPKPALINWAKKFTAEYAVEHFEAFKTLIADDPDGAVEWLKGAAYRDRDRKADLGTLVHAATEAHVLGKPMPQWPPVAKPRMDAFVRFLSDYEPEYVATEASVYNRTERYAGTLDAIADVRGARYLIDTKTGKGVYPESALQMAAYRYAEFIGLPDGDERDMYPVDACAVLHLSDEGEYELVQVRADTEVFKAFLYVREVFRWTQQTSKTVIGGEVPASSEMAQASLPLAETLGEAV